MNTRLSGLTNRARLPRVLVQRLQSTYRAITLDAGIFILLFAAGVLIYLPVLSIRPLDGDNLYVLAWAHSAPPSAIWSVDPAIYPEWRPLPYLTVWLEHAVFGLEWMSGHFIVNIALWVVCSFLVYRLVLDLAGDRVAAMLAATWLLLDRRAIQALTWIVERQTSMACGFGLLALLLVVRAKRDISPIRAVAVGTALVAAALSKEYGLAFAATIFWWGIYTKSGATKAIATIAVMTYAILRFQTAGFDTHGYCEEMGYFGGMQETCFSAWSPRVVAQASYNVVVSLVGTIAPGIVANDGTLYQDRWRLLRSMGLLALALAGVQWGGRPLRAIAVLGVANGFLNFMLYRERNLLIGVCGVAITIGVGSAILPRLVHRQWLTTALRVAIISFLGIVLASRANEAMVRAKSEREQSADIAACTASVEPDPLIEGFAQILKKHYDQECRNSSLLLD